MADKPDQDQKTEAPIGQAPRGCLQEGRVLQSRELGTGLVILPVRRG
jgi:flagellar biosynthesis protein FlhB